MPPDKHKASGNGTPGGGGAGASAWPALTTTILALALVNFGVATLVAQSMGARVFDLSNTAAAGILLVGLVCAAAAVWLWRGFVQAAKRRKAAGTSKNGPPANLADV